ncbi:MAG TPA: hypothetical protein VMJ93_13135 [Verrucomicrobiae bacterium]|nr:hypothetical protein [Verrucomicrobiae bacterium]
MSLMGPGLSHPGPSPPPSGRSIGARAWLVIWSIACIIALIYVGSVFYGRKQEDRELAAQAAERQREKDQEAVEFMGGNNFEILNFYASPGIIRRGDTADLCYGVSNAKTVTISPPSGPTWPAVSRCLSISPKKTTTYTLTIASATGEKKTATLKIEVR